MDTFKDREKGFEAKFAHDMELTFLARVRSHYQAGLWAAGMLGKKGDEAHAYAEAVRIEDFKGSSARAVAARIRRDLEGRVSDAEIDAKIAALRAEAERELRAP
ncbi:DUF1476 domain-containing protein [soil metagenome]